VITFLIKGMLRDKNRSLLPVLIVAIGVALTVFLSGYLRGVMDDVTDINARFETGHVKIMTRSYAENKDQLPVDLAILGVDSLRNSLKKQFPEMAWESRMRFGGILDVPDASRNSRGQGPVLGMALDFLTPRTKEPERMNIPNAMVRGRMPQRLGEILVGEDFAQKLKIKMGDQVTHFGSTMSGSLSFKNFVVTGTVRFGMAAMDRGTILVDIRDAQTMLDMPDGTSEILGYATESAYQDAQMQSIATMFNALQNPQDEFAPVMQTLKQQNNLGELIDYSAKMSGFYVFIFVMAMAVVLWNTGLLGGVRRYKEFGIRLALGEFKGHMYRSLLLESVVVGVVGSVIGLFIGLSGVYYLQAYGLDISGMMENSAMLIPSVIRAKITPDLFVIGFIPGLLATTLGAMLSGIGIFKRQTASLFKELEV